MSSGVRTRAQYKREQEREAEGERPGPSHRTPNKRSKTAAASAKIQQNPQKQNPRKQTAEEQESVVQQKEGRTALKSHIVWSIPWREHNLKSLVYDEKREVIWFRQRLFKDHGSLVKIDLFCGKLPQVGLNVYLVN